MGRQCHNVMNEFLLCILFEVIFLNVPIVHALPFCSLNEKSKRAHNSIKDL